MTTTPDSTTYEIDDEQFTVGGSTEAATEVPADDVVEASRPRLLDRVRAEVASAVAQLRFVSERPRSLRESIADAREGEWTTETDGWRRKAREKWARYVEFPIKAVCFLAAWASESPTRLVPIVAIALITTTALNTIPIVELFVPDGLTITYWLSWIS